MTKVNSGTKHHGIPRSETKPSSELSAAPSRPNCYQCKYRREVPGDAHSSCAHPVVPKGDTFGNMMAIFASVGRVAPVANNEAAAKLNITANPAGVRRGWFNWPWNFDPTWLQSCNGFEPKKPVTSDTGDNNQTQD